MAYDLTTTFDFNSPVSVDAFKADRQDVWTGVWAGVNSISLTQINEGLIALIKELPYKELYLSDDFDKRPDRLAMAFYESFEYTLLVLIQAEVASWDQFKSRTTIRLAARADIETLLIRN
jgi:hypothetical protein